MSELQRVLNLLERNHMEPKRSFGQNFLVNEDSIDKIIDSLKAEDYNTVLEIGPGLGALTLPLIDKAKKLIAVEADRDMFTLLSSLVEGKKNVTLINAPFEHWDHKGLDTTNLLIVGNLPYNLTTKLLELTSQLNAETLGFMVQKEVADKLLYVPNSPENNALSAYLAILGDVEIVLSVPKGSFYPIPKVDSAFVRINIKHKESFDVYKQLKKLYLNPNKTLHNNIKNGYKKEIFDAIEKDFPSFLFEKRARQLTVDEIKNLGEKLCSLSILL